MKSNFSTVTPPTALYQILVQLPQKGTTNFDDRFLERVCTIPFLALLRFTVIPWAFAAERDGRNDGGELRSSRR